MFNKAIFYFVLLFTICLNAQIQQVELDPITADYDRVAKFYWQSGSYIGANNLNADMSLSQNTYFRKDNERWFVLIQWAIPNSLIPDGSTINFVELKFWYDSNNYALEIFHDNVDITNTPLPYSDYNEIYSNSICRVNPQNYGWVSINSDTYSLFNTVLQNSLINDRVTFIVCKDSEVDIPGKVSDPSLTITYTPPSQTVTVMQKYSSGTQFGQVGHYEGGEFFNRNSGHEYTFGINNTESFQAKTTIDNSEKYNNWNTTLSYRNYDDIQIYEDLNSLTVNFKTANTGSVKNYLENSVAATSGNIQLKDPWLRDTLDTKGLRNRGLDAIWKTESGFDLTTSSDYQGVFLEQGYNYETQVWSPPYYQVKAESPQPIYVQGKTRNFYFHKWEGTGASFQSSANLETPVVFNQANAT
ncbi:MAG: hypothetical protein KKG93_17490, partial [Bacteroidetes bacterium]|nr:hypothetical protein [Bacteroidota bacterium]